MRGRLFRPGVSLSGLRKRTQRGAPSRSGRVLFASPIIPVLRWWRAPIGTVYLMRSRGEPDLFKVGFTQRATTARRAELNRVAGDDMVIIWFVSIPWARSCEARALRGLRGDWFRKRDHRGTEWFRLRKSETIDDVIRKLDRAAKQTEWAAKLKLSWPKNRKRSAFRTGAAS